MGVGYPRQHGRMGGSPLLLQSVTLLVLQVVLMWCAESMSFWLWFGVWITVGPWLAHMHEGMVHASVHSQFPFSGALNDSMGWVHSLCLFGYLYPYFAFQHRRHHEYLHQKDRDPHYFWMPRFAGTTVVYRIMWLLSFGFRYLYAMNGRGISSFMKYRGRSQEEKFRGYAMIVGAWLWWLYVYYACSSRMWWWSILSTLCMVCPLHPCGTHLLAAYVRSTLHTPLKPVYDYTGPGRCMLSHQGCHTLHYKYPDVPNYMLPWYQRKRKQKAASYASYISFLETFLYSPTVMLD